MWFGLDKVALQILGLVFVVGLLLSGYFYWKHSIKVEALKEWNRKQIELVQQENAKTVEKLKELSETKDLIIKDLQKKKTRIDKKFSDLDMYIDSKPVREQHHNKPSSDVLKRTFKELNR